MGGLDRHVEMKKIGPVMFVIFGGVIYIYNIHVYAYIYIYRQVSQVGS